MSESRNERESLDAGERLRAGWRASPSLAAEPSAPTWEQALRLLALRQDRAAAEAGLARRLGALPRPASARDEAVVAGVLRDARAFRAAPAPAPVGRLICRSDELVLCQAAAPEGGLLVHRRYLVCDPAGRELGEVQQVGAAGDVPDVGAADFHALDRISGQTFVFQRAGERLHVLDELGAQHGFVHWKAGAEPAAFKIVSSLDRGMMQVKTQLEHPFALRVLDKVGDEVGTIERRFVGFGAFLRDTNQMRIRVELTRVSPAQCWTLVAVAMLVGTRDERPDQSPASGS